MSTHQIVPLSRPLHKASSLVLNASPAPSALKAALPQMKPGEGEVIPDSEEERLQLLPLSSNSLKLADKSDVAVIEISSDEEDSVPGVRSQPVPRTPKRRHGQTPRARRIIHSSSSEASDDDTEAGPALRAGQRRPAGPPRTPARSTGPVIDLTLSSSEHEDDPGKHTARPAAKPRYKAPAGSDPDQDVRPMSLYADDSSDDEQDSAGRKDDSILTLNEPRSARKPVLKPTLSAPGFTRTKSGPSTPCSASARILSYDSSSGSDRDASSQVAKRTPTSTPRKAGKAPRTTKKALAAAEQARRESYARALFDELNRTVFGGGIPAETELKWNKRLLTTAGRAKWHRSRDGAQTSEIELAVKILDCDERIRNTLSHEMCHLACWIINGEPKENHGQIFHGWANKVMRARTDIEVTTRHDYEITYKFEWKCEECSKIYGRHSKSIRPDECVCGSCKTGKLIPLFETQQRAPKTPKTKAGSRLASEKGRDSPVAAPSPMDVSISISVQQTPVRSKARTMPGSFVTVVSSDDDASDVEVLTHVLGAVRISEAGIA